AAQLPRRPRHRTAARGRGARTDPHRPSGPGAPSPRGRLAARSGGPRGTDPDPPADLAHRPQVPAARAARPPGRAAGLARADDGARPAPGDLDRAPGRGLRRLPFFLPRPAARLREISDLDPALRPLGAARLRPPLPA